MRATVVMSLAVSLPAGLSLLGAGPLPVSALVIAGIALVVVTTTGLVARLEEERRQARFLESHLRRASLAASTLPLAKSFLEEVRGSFASIVVSAQAIGEKGSDPAEVSENLAVMRATAMRCRGLVDRFQAALAVPEAGAAVGDIDLNAVIEDLAELLTFETYHRRIEVEKSLARDLPGVRAEYGRVRQVLQAVLLNAVEAIGQDGRIAVETRAGDGAVVVTVVDTGPGIAGDPERAFDPLFSTRRDGVGLGLTLCRSILERMGGSISAANEPDLGARLTIRFPSPAAASGR